MVAIKGFVTGMALLALTAGPAFAQKVPAEKAKGLQAPTAEQSGARWLVNCAGGGKDLSCQASQTFVMKNTGQRFLTVAVRVPSDTKRPMLALMLPHGIYLPAGATVQFGADAGKAIQVVSCEQGGCFAEYALPDTDLGAMLKDTEMTVSVQNMKKEPITIKVPTAGFAVAYAKIK